VFNKHYLDYELEDVLLKLQVEPQLHPEIESTSSGIASNLNVMTEARVANDLASLETLGNAAILHYDTVVHVFNTLHVQYRALRIASTSLDLHVLSISDVFESFAGGGRRELEKQAHLLRGLDLDLEVISQIRIHPEFLSPAVRKAVEAGEKARTLGDYVSNVKMRQVGDACAKTHSMSLLDRSFVVI
jgi:autophagy-related protein 11